MENLQRDMEETVRDPGLQRPRRRPSGSSLLFVGNNGKIVRIQSFKGFILAWGILFFIFLIAAIWLGLLYLEKTRELRSLEAELQASRERIKSLRHEKDVLMARVVVSGKKARTESSKQATPEKKDEKSAQLQWKKEGKGKPKIEVASAVPEVATVTVPEVGSATDSTESLKPTRPPTVVAVDDFFVLIESGSNTLRIKYKIRNIHPDSLSVSGRTFLLLKSNEEDLKTWLILPDTPMKEGRPTVIKSGRSFSITRFKTIRFKAPYQEDTDPFMTATVLVYASSGELILEKSFPIESNNSESPLS